MSIQFFDIEIPVLVRRSLPESNREDASLSWKPRRLTVQVVMGPDATEQDAVESLARKLDLACNLTDVGDEE